MAPCAAFDSSTCNLFTSTTTVVSNGFIQVMQKVDTSIGVDLSTLVGDIAGGMRDGSPQRGPGAEPW